MSIIFFYDKIMNMNYKLNTLQERKVITGVR